MADQATHEHVVTEVPTDLLHAGDNPRLSMDEDGLKELQASIARDGILEPLRVTRNESGYRIESGHRRWTIALALGITSVPVRVVDEGDKADEYARALITNIQREQINPVDEALAYNRLMTLGGLTKAGVAERIGIKPSRVTIRLELLDLPTEIVELYREEKLPLAARKALKDLADIDADLAVEVAEAAAGKQEWAEVLIDDPIRVVAYVASESKRRYELAPARFDAKALYDEFPTKRKSTKAGVALGDLIADNTPDYMTFWVEINDQDADAAAAAGVLYRPDPEQKGVICSEQFLWELLPSLVDRTLKQREARAVEQAVQEAKRKPSKEALESDDPEVAAAAERAKEAKREERALELEGRATAQALNEALGAKLYAELPAPTKGVPLRTAQLFTAEWTRQLHDLAGQGIRYCLPAFWVDQTKKTGTKRTYVDSKELLASAETFLKVADGDEYLRRIEIILVCARYADQGAVALSNRIGAHNHGGHPQPVGSLNGTSYSPASPALKDLEQRVKALVPAPLRGKVRPSEKPLKAAQAAKVKESPASE